MSLFSGICLSSFKQSIYTPKNKENHNVLQSRCHKPQMLVLYLFSLYEYWGLGFHNTGCNSLPCSAVSSRLSSAGLWKDTKKLRICCYCINFPPCLCIREFQEPGLFSSQGQSDTPQFHHFSDYRIFSEHSFKMQVFEAPALRILKWLIWSKNLLCEQRSKGSLFCEQFINNCM